MSSKLKLKPATTTVRMPAHAAQPNVLGMVKILTCGSVDDGKSTLIGRLLWDASDLPEDSRQAVIKAGKSAGFGQHYDYSLLVDGLVAEREQGITIDVAWRYFDTATRRFVIIDSPGHEQYTRNMASGASHADVGIMLIDARDGVKTQTRRHAAILDLVGVCRVILAVNKMDLVDWNERVFRDIERDFAVIAQRFGFTGARAIPVAALSGDNIARRSDVLGWYDGPTLLQELESLDPSRQSQPSAFRMPVQTVLRDGLRYRALAGTVASGALRPGDEIVDATTGLAAHVKSISTMDGPLAGAVAGRAIAVELDRDLDIGRGAVLSHPHDRPTAARSLTVRWVWLAPEPYDPRATYMLRTATDLVPVNAIDIAARLDLVTLEATSARACGVNDLVDVEIEVGRPVAVDAFKSNRETGCIMLVDAVSGASVAGGVVLSARTERQPRTQRFVITRHLLEQGLCADLKDAADAAAEMTRRADELAVLMKAAGLDVDIEL